MNPHVAARTVVALLLALAITAACGGSGGGPGPSRTPDVALQACLGVQPLTPAAEVPLLPTSPCELPAFDFATFQLLMGQLQGSPVVVNIWASWCGPCRAEAPHLARLSRALEGKVQFLGVDMEDLRSPAREFIAEYDWGYPQVFDESATIRDGLGLIGQPHTLIFDASGAQRFVWSGAVTEEMLKAEIQKVLES